MGNTIIMPTTGFVKKKKAVKKSSGRRAEGDMKNLDTAAEVALYYGFTVLPPPSITKTDIKKAREIIEAEARARGGGAPHHFCLEEKVAILRLYLEKSMQNLPQPVLLYFGEPILPQGGNKKRADRERECHLEIIGTTKSIAEATIIKTSMEILKEEGYGELSLSLNSIGDRESMARFVRELTIYYRKNMDALPAHCRQLMKKDVLDLLECQDEKCQPLKKAAPKVMSFLSEPSREHFKEILEFLEILEIPYEIEDTLVDNRAFCTQTIFEIRAADVDKNSHPLAEGVCYSNLGKRLGLARDISSVSAKILFKPKEHESHSKTMKKSKIFFIQLGFDAKLKCLKVVEMLRRAKIPMSQCLSRDKMTAQLSIAESMKIPYTVIMGQKEAVEDTVIVRTMADRSQETVPLKNLPDYLKRLK